MSYSNSLVGNSESCHDSKYELDQMVDRVKPWLMVHGLAHGS